VYRRTLAGWTRTDPSTNVNVRALYANGPSFVLVAKLTSMWIWMDGAWAESPTVPYPVFYGLWGASPQDIWAVGRKTSAGGASQGAMTYHYDGKAWKEHPPSAISTNLRGVSGSAANDVWAVGDAGVILHRAGGDWQRVPSGTTLDLHAVWAESASRAWAVADQGTILRWSSGAGWEPVPPVTQDALYAIWGAGPSQIWAVGASGTILLYDGSRWRQQWSGTASTLRAVHGHAGTTWVAGDNVVLRSP
jgi:hypothetical protein